MKKLPKVNIVGFYSSHRAEDSMLAGRKVRNILHVNLNSRNWQISNLSVDCNVFGTQNIVLFCICRAIWHLRWLVVVFLQR